LNAKKDCFIIPSLVGSQVGDTGEFILNTCFDTVTWTIELIENADINTGQAAGMRINYSFDDINLDVLCAFMQCIDEQNTNRGFSICSVGTATDTGFTIYVNRTDMIEDWNTSAKFLLTYFHSFF
jgi:hypothetical protein